MTDATTGPPQNTPPPLLTAQDIARMLQVSVRTVWRLRDSGKIPRAVTIGGSIRWRTSEIQRWIEVGCPAEVNGRGSPHYSNKHRNAEKDRC